MKVESYLKKRGLMASTREVYGRVGAVMDRKNPVRWLEGEISQRQPLGTLLPKRAMAKHVMVSELGISPEEADVLLPKLKGRKGKVRNGLTKQQYEAYLTEVSRKTDPTIRTILFLLPLTGLRIGEMCKLKKENLQKVGDRSVLRFQGKGDKDRIVPLSVTAQKLLEEYVKAYPESEWVFLGLREKPLTPSAVRMHTRGMAVRNPLLTGLSPHVLRHTFASLADRKGVSLRQLQSILGHEQITTTSRYLHPTTEDLLEAIDQMGD